MKKVELVEAVATKAGLTKADAARAVDATFEVITEALAKGDRVPLVGFEHLQFQKEQLEQDRNPQTGAVVNIAARNAVTFKAGAALKESVN